MNLYRLAKPNTFTHDKMNVKVLGYIHIPFWCFWWQKWKETHAIMIVEKINSPE